MVCVKTLIPNIKTSSPIFQIQEFQSFLKIVNSKATIFRSHKNEKLPISPTHKLTWEKIRDMQFDYSTASHRKSKQRLGHCCHGDDFMWFSSSGNLTKSPEVGENHQQKFSNIWQLPTNQWGINTFILSSSPLKHLHIKLCEEAARLCWSLCV